jgi:hypothetical protein
MNFLTNWFNTRHTMTWVVNDLRLVVNIYTPKNRLGDLLRVNYVEIFNRDELVRQEPSGGKTVAEAQSFVVELAREYIRDRIAHNTLVNDDLKSTLAQLNANPNI